MTILPADAAPFAYHDIYDFPEDYEPWRLNYKGHGLFIGILLMLFWCNIK